jgi:hypothetical protein
VVDTYGRKENLNLLTQTNNHTFLHHAIQTLLCYDVTRDKQCPETPDCVLCGPLPENFSPLGKRKKVKIVIPGSYTNITRDCLPQ